MNKYVCSGRLGKDIELRYTQGPNPLAVARGSIAVPNPKKDDKKHVEWINFTMWGDKAVNLEKYAHKGDKIMLAGIWSQNDYEKDGKKVYSYQFTATEFELCEPKPQQQTADLPAEEIPFN